MTNILRTSSDNKNFQTLIVLLDNDLYLRDGEDHSFYSQFNKTVDIKNIVLCFENNEPIGCGAFKNFDLDKIEIKRMFVRPEFRGDGIGYAILKELETWALELNYKSAVLETGKKQPEAIRLYQKAGYNIIPNFGQYENVENSICMIKQIA